MPQTGGGFLDKVLQKKQGKQKKQRSASCGTLLSMTPPAQHATRARPYEQLIVWQEAHKLCLDVYALIPQFPIEERFCLCSQIRRAAYSVPMNLVEGNSKRSWKEKARYVEIAEGSLEELDYQLLLSKDLKCFSYFL